MPNVVSNPSGRPCGTQIERAALRDNNAFLRGTRESPWTTSLKFEYEKDGLHRWTSRRVWTVAKIFHCTVPELCAIAGEFDTERIARYEKSGEWPMTLTLQWAKMLRFRFKQLGPDIQDQAAAKYLNWTDPEEHPA